MVDETFLNAVWCKDRETSEEILINLKTGEKLLIKYKDGSMGVFYEAK